MIRRSSVPTKQKWTPTSKFEFSDSSVEKMTPLLSMKNSKTVTFHHQSLDKLYNEHPTGIF